MQLADYKASSGVNDLPPKTRTAFAAALQAEDKGDCEKAEKWLLTAVKYEEEGI